VPETAELVTLHIPVWGCILLLGLAAAYLVLGSVWSRLFDVLSMTFLGCVAGLVISPWVPLRQALVITAGGVLVGGLAALVRGPAHAVLTALVLAAVLAVLVGNIVGPTGFTSYLVVSLSEEGYSTQWRAPNLRCDAVLAAVVTGLLVGSALALGWRRLSRRLVTSAQGAALVLVATVELAGTYQGPGRPPVTETYPLTLTAAWVSLVAIGMRIQQGVERLLARRGETETAEGE